MTIFAEIRWRHLFVTLADCTKMLTAQHGQPSGELWGVVKILVLKSERAAFEGGTHPSVSHLFTTEADTDRDINIELG